MAEFFCNFRKVHNFEFSFDFSYNINYCRNFICKFVSFIKMFSWGVCLAFSVGFSIVLFQFLDFHRFFLWYFSNAGSFCIGFFELRFDRADFTSFISFITGSVRKITIAAFSRRSAQLSSYLCDIRQRDGHHCMLHRSDPCYNQRQNERIFEIDDFVLPFQQFGIFKYLGKF